MCTSTKRIKKFTCENRVFYEKTACGHPQRGRGSGSCGQGEGLKTRFSCGRHKWMAPYPMCGIVYERTAVQLKVILTFRFNSVYMQHCLNAVS